MKYRFELITANVIILLMLFSGCSTGPDNCRRAGEKKLSDTITENNSPVVLNYISCEHSKTPLNGNAPVWKELCKRTNIKINFITIDYSSEYNVEVLTMLASGVNADLVNMSADELNRIGDRIAVCLNDLIAERGTNLRKVLKPDIKVQIMDYDKRIFGIPLISKTLPGYTWMVRKDCLDFFGLGEPQTIDDWEHLWKLVRDKNFEDDKIQPKIPVCPRKPDEVLKMVVFPIFGIGSSDFCLKSNRLVYIWTTKECREAVRWLKSLYTKGYLYDKYNLTNPGTWEDMVISGRLISTQGPVFRVSVFNEQMKTAKGMKIMATVPPLGPYGDRGMKPSSKVNTVFCIAILKESKKREAAFSFIDYLFSKEGSILTTWGIEGVTYDLADGKKVWKDDIYKNRHNYRYLSRYGIMYFLFPRLIDPGQSDLYMTSEDSKNAVIKNQKYLLDEYPFLAYPEKRKIKVQDIKYRLEAIVYSYFNRFIMNEIPLNDITWNRFMNELVQNGVHTYENIENEAYERYKELYKTLQ